MTSYAPRKIAAELVFMDALSKLLDRNARRSQTVYSRWRLLITGMLVGLQFNNEFFPGSTIIIVVVADFIAWLMRKPFERDGYDEFDWLLGGIALGLMIPGTATPPQVILFLCGYLLWPQFEKITSNNWNQLMLVGPIIFVLAASITVDIYTNGVMPGAKINTGALGPCILFGAMVRACLNYDRLIQVKKKRGRRRYAR